MTDSDTVLLVHHEKRPRLRLLRLSPGSTMEPAPVTLDQGYAAIDDCVPRDGWLACAAQEQIWGIPSSFAEPTFHVGQSWGLIQAEDPRTVWLAPSSGYEEVPSRFTEYDGVARARRRTVELEPGLTLHAAVAEGLVVGPVEAGILQLHRWDDGRRTELVAGTWVKARHGELLAVEVDHDDLMIFDVARRQSMPVPRPAGRTWGTFCSFSPDGGLLAIDLGPENLLSSEEQRAIDLGPDALSEAELEAPFEAFMAPEPYEPMRTRMALIDTATGDMRVTDEDFDNFATTPVWTPDSACAFFAAPFDKGLWRCDATLPEPRLERVLGLRSAAPIADVTSLVGRS